MSYTHSLVTVLVLAVIFIVIGFLLYKQFQKQYKLNAATVLGVFFGLVAAMLLLQAILYWPGSEQQIYAELACMSGASLGWIIGMWLSPMGSSESTKFSRYWTVIGVGSGFTLKWGMDRILQNAGWFRDHAFITTLFAVSLFVTVAAVYNSRAYDNSLTIAPRKPLASTTVVDGDCVEVKVGAAAEFYAAVVGPSDPLTRWEVLPASLGTMDGTGLFTAGATTGEGRITAFNLEDPTLSNFINLKVT